jgi:hypothetical protein
MRPVECRVSAQSQWKSMAYLAREREVKKALRRLFKQRLHEEQEQFDREYRHIGMCY